MTWHDDIVAPCFNPSIWESETGRTQWVQCHQVSKFYFVFWQNSSKDISHSLRVIPSFTSHRSVFRPLSNTKYVLDYVFLNPQFLFQPTSMLFTQIGSGVYSSLFFFEDFYLTPGPVEFSTEVILAGVIGKFPTAFAVCFHQLVFDRPLVLVSHGYTVPCFLFVCTFLLRFLLSDSSVSVLGSFHALELQILL